MAGKKVLLIDDDEDIREIMQLTLKGQGYSVVTAADGNAGLALAEQEAPDLVVVDMMMPKKSGFLVIEKLKTPGGSSPKVLMVTANEGDRHRAYAELLGADDYLRKPFGLEEFLAIVNRLCPLE